MGIRPEHIGSPASYLAKDAPKIDVEINVIEPMGSESYVYCKNNENKLVSKMDPHNNLSIGEKIQIPLLINNVHFFDSETENVII